MSCPIDENSKKGFTLIELIIVVIIIGILASIAAPMMTGMKRRAICAEAVTTLGAIRSALRAYLVEDPNLDIPGNACHLSDPASSDLMAKLGLTSEGINGTYFYKECYGITHYPPVLAYAVYCTVDKGDPSPGSSIIDAGSSIGYLVMYVSNGNIKQIGMSCSGYPLDNGLPGN
jgi:type IV pilus assembly protein PilA